MKQIKKSRRRKKSNEHFQSRKFIILFVTFLLIFFMINYISKFKYTKPNSNENKMTELDSLKLYFSDIDTSTTQIDTMFNVTSNIDQIKLCTSKLGILDNLIKIKQTEGIINVQLPINPSKLDLNFTNYYITKHLTKQKWKLESGLENESGSVQKLTFLSPDLQEKYVINIYYDQSKSYPIEKPKIAIIISELGDTKVHNLISYLKIPYPINYAIIPFRKNSQSIYSMIETSNHDILINVPMEDINYPKIDHGKYGLSVKMNESDINDSFDRQFKEFPKAKGCINYLGSLATTDEKLMAYFMDIISKHGLYFVDNLTPSTSMAYTVAQQKVIPSYKKTINLDFSQKNEKIKDKIALIKSINNNDQLILINILKQHLSTPEDLSTFCELLLESGYELVYISSIEESSIF